MRVALLAFHFAEYATRLALALSECHTVLLILNAENAKKELTEELKSKIKNVAEVVEVPWFATKNFFWIRWAILLRKKLKDFRPDVIHAQENFSDAYFWSVTPRTTRPLVLTVHDHVPHSGVDSRGIRPHHRIYYSYMRRHCDAVIVHSEIIAEEYRRLPEGYDRSVYSVPHGVLGCEIDTEVSITTSSANRTLLFFGRVEAYKGLQVLLDACDILFRREVPFDLIVAGRGTDLVNHLGRLTSRPWAEVRDRFIPASEVPSLFSRARITVLPYTDATQSGVAAMAFAHHCPVVASRVGGLPEVVKNEFSGLLVPPGDAEALAAAIERLLLDDALHSRLSHGAAQMVEHTLNWQSIADKTTEVYSSVIRERSGLSSQ